MAKLEIIIKDTHRGLWYEDGVLTKTLEAGRYQIPLKRLGFLPPNAQAYAKHPALLRMLELETMTDLSRNANARIYIGFDKHTVAEAAKDGN